jgi:DNA-binding NarL/FixJ family response regulator
MITLPRLARGLAEIVEDLLSGTRLPELEQGIKRLQRESRISERQVREAFDQEPVRGQLADLSRREREILSLMAQGKSNAGIAKALYITEGSVEKHISSILSKLGLRPEADGHRRVLAVLAYLGIHHSPTSS